MVSVVERTLSRVSLVFEAYCNVLRVSRCDVLD